MISDNFQPVKILLVEDNVQDIEITQRAFAKGRVRNELTVVRDGEEAIEYLYHRGKYQDPATSPRPGSSSTRTGSMSRDCARGRSAWPRCRRC